MRRRSRLALLLLALAPLAGAPLAAQDDSACAACDAQQLGDAGQLELEGRARALSREVSRLELACDTASSSAVRRARERDLLRARRNLELVARTLAARMARVAPDDGAPRGWMGISYVGAMQHAVRGGEVIVRHMAYPVVAAVEPGSPAARAGVLAGDTIRAYDDRDLLDASISYSRLLVPGRRVTVTVRRDGRSLELPVVVTRRPAGFATRVGPTPPAVPEPPLPDLRLPRAPRPAPHPFVLFGDDTPEVMVRSGDAAVAPLPPTPAMEAFSRFVLAGAEVTRVNPQLGDAIGVRHGVLVLDVGEGTPAARAGLRGGDVVVAAAGRRVATPLDLQRSIRWAYEREEPLELTVVRKKKERKLALRW